MIFINMKSIRIKICLVAMVLLGLWGYPLYSKETGQISIDDLFNQPVEDGQNEDQTKIESESINTQTEESVNLDALTTSPTVFSGSVSAGVGIGAGLVEWPGSNAAEKKSFSDLMRYSGFYLSTATLGIDARPEPWLRFYSSFSVNLDAEKMIFTGPNLNEVFVDYTLKDTVFFRAGKQGLTWGHGRLLENPANLVSRVSEGVALRVTLPAGNGTLNGVVYSKGGWVDNPYPNIDPRTFAYAGQWESSMGPLAFSLAGHFKMKDDSKEDIGSTSSISFGIGSFDLAVDLVGHWDRENPAWGPAEWEGLGQLFWENDDRSWSLLSEYMFDSSVESVSGHYIALGLKTPRFRGSGWQPTLRWKHAFQDNSGELVTGISGSIAQGLSFAMGIPVVYGTPGSYYRAALSENLNLKEGDIDEEASIIPIDNVVSLLFSITLSFSF
ncbi:MAG: hypothetical protein J7L71_10540 [Spirochaetaceae bacterium]|nr:hypothetical protein [Spirochaetaceae bacterium]